MLDAVRSAVALPQPDPQDRLRVLIAASQVIRPISPWLEKLYAREGTQLEAELISRGQQPAASMIVEGRIDCATAAQFVESVPNVAVPQAEQSLIGIVSSCPRQGVAPVRWKVEGALDEGMVAPRVLMSLVDRVGPTSAWAQSQFVKMFDNLPSDAERVRAYATDIAAVYDRMASAVEKDQARSAGLKMLEWLSGVRESGERNIAVNTVTSAMRNAFGEAAYQDALSSNVVAASVARTAGRPGQVELTASDNGISVLKAMGEQGDHTATIASLPTVERARQAAAHGFASGVQGDRATADRYFDLAFSVADEIWEKRRTQANAAAIVREITEAAAQVDAVTALKRAQELADPSAQALAMLAVARVVLGQEATESVRPR